MSLKTSELGTSKTGNDAAVRALYQQLMDGWNKGSGEAFAAVFADDGDLVAFDGTHFSRPREIIAFHEPLFNTFLKGTRLVGQVKSVRFLAPNIALMHALGGTVMRGKTAPSPERDSIQTLVAVKQGDQWRVAAFQNTRVRPMGRNATSIFLWIFTDFLWKMFRPNR